jgi:MarR family transcriptional regulator, organic hydroperoxide resistance regulator
MPPLPINKESNGLLSHEDAGFDIKVTWLAIAKHFAPLAAAQGITVSMGFVLLNISKEKGASATKIAPLIGMEPRSLTRLLKKLEEMKLIIRKPDPEDGRGVRVFLSDKGAQIKKLAKKNVESFNNMLKGEIPAERMQQFFQTLEQIHRVIEKHKISA